MMPESTPPGAIATHAVVHRKRSMTVVIPRSPPPKPSSGSLSHHHQLKIIDHRLAIRMLTPKPTKVRFQPPPKGAGVTPSLSPYRRLSRKPIVFGEIARPRPEPRCRSVLD